MRIVLPIAPLVLRQFEQWHIHTPSNSPSSSYFSAPHRQLPFLRMRRVYADHVWDKGYAKTDAGKKKDIYLLELRV